MEGGGQTIRQLWRTRGKRWIGPKHTLETGSFYLFEGLSGAVENEGPRRLAEAGVDGDRRTEHASLNVG